MMRSRALALWAASAATCFAVAAPDDRIILPTNVVPDHYEISVEPDAKALTFKGTVSIHLAVREATDSIVLNSADIVIDHASLSGTAAAPTITYDTKVQTAAFGFPAKLAPGDYTLSLEYHGLIYQQASGLFALDYDAAGGRKRALFTQFEATDARRFVPCWDEPAIKATFGLTVTVPADLMAISNMPIASSDPLPGGLATVHFAQTPKMSPYLLFFGLGDLERVHRMVDGVDVGVIVKRGETASCAYALDTACKILPFYNDYFGTPYPLPKLDLIAGPGSSQFFSAMENWGAIFYFERALLFDPKISSETDRRRIHVVIAHEMSHQWFGDLVTMQWWDGIWLNEGFASWMQEKATDHLHPEWKEWLDALTAKQGAMQLDARDGTHPVITPINDILQANSSFDGITYSKGESVIRMFEAYVGEDAFRAGVRRYMKDHAYGATVTDNLWAEIDAGSDRKLTGVAHDFTLQAGVPMLTVTASGTGLALKEDRFAYDTSGTGGGAWTVPAIIQPGQAGGKPVLRMVEPGAVAVVDAPPGSVVNSGQAGYFRVLYEGEAFTALSKRFASLDPYDQVGILIDAYAFGCSGRAPLPNLLDLAAHLPVDAYPSVWATVSDRLGALDRIYDGLPTQGAYRKFVSGVLGPVLRHLGSEVKASDSANTRILRTELLGTLGQTGDPEVKAWALARFEAYLKDPSTLSGSDRDSVLSVVAVNADQATWDQIHALAHIAPTQLEKNQEYQLLGQARDPALAAEAMAIALTQEADVTLRPRLVSATSFLHPEMAVEFAVVHWDVLSPMIEPTVRHRYVPRLAANAVTTDILAPLEAFASAQIAPTAQIDLRKAVSQIRYSAAIRSDRLPSIDRWLAAGAGAAKP
jgi:aminopeptidase N